jgi:hypothetical protein
MPLYTFLHNLLKVLVQTANKMGLQKIFPDDRGSGLLRTLLACAELHALNQGHEDYLTLDKGALCLQFCLLQDNVTVAHSRCKQWAKSSCMWNSERQSRCFTAEERKFIYTACPKKNCVLKVTKMKCVGPRPKRHHMSVATTNNKHS